MKKVIFLLAFMMISICFSQGTSADAFITKWTTTDPNQSITITISNNFSGYNFTVDWGDGQTTTNATDDVTHEYVNADDYQVVITGVFPALRLQSSLLDEVVQWGTNPWQSTELMFAGSQNMNITATDTPDLTNVTSMRNMFNLCSSMNANINTWDVNNVINFEGVFRGAAIFNQPLDNWDVSNAMNLSNMFFGARSFNQNINNWKTSNVTTTAAMFRDAITFDEPLDDWDMSNVEDVSEMFRGALIFNQNLDDWITDKFNNTGFMFMVAQKFNQSLSNWNMENVTNISSMFNGAVDFNQNINNWNTSKVENTSGAFDNAVSFNQPLDQWDMSNVTDMSSMFAEAVSFNQNIDNWDVSSVTSASVLFLGATSFNQPLNSWDVRNIQGEFEAVFENASSFNQSLSNWRLEKVEALTNFFDGSGMSTQNYDATLVGWSAMTTANFSVRLGAAGITHCQTGQDAKDLIISKFNWRFFDDGLDTSCTTLSAGEFENSETSRILFDYTTKQLQVTSSEKSILSYFDITGRKINTKNVEKGRTIIDLSEIASSGLYIFRLTSGESNKSISKKIVM
ncbi:BspA family leucine-rich repeat surface protein [Aquimarina sp. RZ0]|uniref:BspA family leucine-rich repeat surface protein n=1 Tax=Aquimarina sp. RZ0 TaxID=2607730 RepID=UPI0011F242CF|nr:BspA family leucine-rich repeat surface protein [Aquimarina sp. RZ0]KAA1244029.1 BspA family leucine-rich repeat surface protein [Aquimarina sp. RZ0]